MMKGTACWRRSTRRFQIGRKAGCPVQISHHKVMGRQNWGTIDRSIAAIDRAIDGGVDVTTDVYPYAASSTILRAVAAQGIEDGDDAAGDHDRRYQGRGWAWRESRWPPPRPHGACPLRTRRGGSLTLTPGRS